MEVLFSQTNVVVDAANRSNQGRGLSRATTGEKYFGVARDQSEGSGGSFDQEEVKMGHEARVAIVTGAGQGIGAAIATKLAGEGYAVVIAECNNETANQIAKIIIERGGQASSYQTDVSVEESVRSMVQFTQGQYGRIDVLVNNAGIYPKSNVVNMSKQEWDRVITINLKSAYLCCKHVLPKMISQKSGKIVNITSSHAYRGGAGFSHYSASKAGLIGLTKSIALEVAQAGIQVNAVAPAVTDTQMPRQHSSEEELLGKASKIPMGRLVRPEDIAELVAYLVSDRNTFITGQTICVNGGAVMLG